MLVGLSATFITGPDSDDENIGGAMTAIFGFVFCIGSIVCIVRPLMLTIDETGVEIREGFARAKRIAWHDVLLDYRFKWYRENSK